VANKLFSFLQKANLDGREGRNGEADDELNDHEVDDQDYGNDHVQILKKLFPLVKEHEDILRKLYYAEHTLEAC
jgi:hypothetical protein